MLKTKKSFFGILLCFVTVVCLTLSVTFAVSPNKAFADDIYDGGPCPTCGQTLTRYSSLNTQDDDEHHKDYVMCNNCRTSRLGTRLIDHNYSNGVCVDCGHVCLHLRQTVGEQCAFCGLTVVNLYDDDPCPICDAKHVDPVNLLNFDHYEKYDDAYHYSCFYCDNCWKIQSPNEAHNYDDNGCCTICGYSCSHYGQTEGEECDWCKTTTVFSDDDYKNATYKIKYSSAGEWYEMDAQGNGVFMINGIYGASGVNISSDRLLLNKEWFALDDSNLEIIGEPVEGDEVTYVYTVTDKTTASIKIIKHSATETAPYSFNFETNPIYNGWINIDKDGDGQLWYWIKDSKEMKSVSWTAATGGLNPDNWLISPKISIPSDGAKISWDAECSDKTLPEHYGIFLCDDLDNLDNAILITEKQAASQSWESYSIKVPEEYWGKDYHVAFRHYNSQNKHSINIDNFTLSSFTDDDYLNSIYKIQYAPNWEWYTMDAQGNGVSMFNGIYGASGVNISSDEIPVPQEWFALDDSNVEVIGEPVDGDEVTYVYTVTDKTTVSVKIIKYSATQTAPYSFDFETNPIYNGWTNIDKDGDGHKWNWISGDKSMQSESWSSATSSLNPDNWLISPKISIPSENTKISWEAKSGNPTYPDHYGIFLCDNLDNLDNAILLAEKQATSQSYASYLISIPSEYWGKDYYVAFRHYNSYDQFYFYINNFTVAPYTLEDYLNASYKIKYSSTGDWHTMDMVDSGVFMINGIYGATGVNISSDDLTVPQELFALDDSNVEVIGEPVEGDNVTYVYTVTDETTVSVKIIKHSATVSAPYYYDFETPAIYSGWTSIDKDGDGQDWATGTRNYGYGNGINGSNCAVSQSYDNSFGKYNADNWLFSPAIVVPAIGAKISWYEKSQDARYLDSYMVYVGETISTEEYDETSNPTGMKQIYSGQAANPWKQIIVELPATEYGGKTVYIAFRHKSYDCYMLDIDNFAAEELHYHNLVKVDGQPATEESAGWSDYYECKESDDACGALFEDEDGTILIEDLETWKSNEGNGYLPILVHTITPVDGQTATQTESGFKPYYECVNCGKYYEDEEGTIEIEDISAWKALGGSGHIASGDEEIAEAKANAKALLDAENANDPLLDDTALTNGKANIDNATTLEEIEYAKNSAIWAIQDAQAEELAIAKENAKSSIEKEDAKNASGDQTDLINGKKDIDGATTKSQVEEIKSSTIEEIQNTQKGNIDSTKTTTKTLLDDLEAQDPLTDKTILEALKASIDGATSDTAIELAKSSAISAIQKAQKAELENAKTNALSLLDAEEAKDPLTDKTALTNGRNSIYNATTKAEVESAKNSAITAVRNAQSSELAAAKSNAKTSLDSQASSGSALTNGKSNIDKATTKAEVETAKSSAVKAIQETRVSKKVTPDSLLWLWIIVAVVVIGCIGTAAYFAKKVSKE